jgi:hypothetical protein
MKRLMPVAIVVFALMACLSACDRAQAPPGSAGESYVAMAMQSPAGKALGLSLFPKEAGTTNCTIRGGGPPPGILVPGVCATRVLVRGNEATVQFKESWNARRFYAGSFRHGRLSHTWEITVSKQAAPGDHVIGVREYGDFPPQLVR